MRATRSSVAAKFSRSGRSTCRRAVLYACTRSTVTLPRVTLGPQACHLADAAARSQGANRSVSFSRSLISGPVRRQPNWRAVSRTRSGGEAPKVRRATSSMPASSSESATRPMGRSGSMPRTRRSAGPTGDLEKLAVPGQDAVRDRARYRALNVGANPCADPSHSQDHAQPRRRPRRCGRVVRPRRDGGPARRARPGGDVERSAVPELPVGAAVVVKEWLGPHRGAPSIVSASAAGYAWLRVADPGAVPATSRTSLAASPSGGGCGSAGTPARASASASSIAAISDSWSPDPRGRPHPVDAPTEALKHLLPQPVAVASGGRAVVGRPVALNSKIVPSAVLRQDREVYPIARDADLRLRTRWPRPRSAASTASSKGLSGSPVPVTLASSAASGLRAYSR